MSESLTKLSIAKSVILQPFSTEHASLLMQWASRSSNSEFFRRIPPLMNWATPEATLALWKGSWTILEDGRPVGIGIASFGTQADRSCEVGLMIDADASSQRSLTSALAMRQAFEYCFDYCNVHKITMRVLTTREGLKQNLLKLGCSVEATLRDSIFFQGEYHDEWLLSCLKLEYKR